MTVFFDYILGELRLKDTSGGGGGSAGSLEAIQIDQSGGTSDTYGVLSGTINGSNTTFTVSKTEYLTGTLRVFLNGQLQTQGTAEDWVETTPASGTFDFNTAPQSGDEITVVYNYTSTTPVDSLVVNSLSVLSTASINTGYFNKLYASTATIGNLTTNNIAVTSNASFNVIHSNSIYNVSTISTNGLGLNFAQWNSLTSLGPLEGLMNWSSLYGTIQLGLAGGTVDVPLGLTTNLPKRVRNSTGSLIPKGTAVYLDGVSGNTPLIERALATGDRTSAFTIGMTAEDIADNATGWVTSFGLIRGVNTSSFTSGDTLYLSGATAGYYTNVPTKAPTHYVRVGTVTKASADGEIIVNVINGYELDELHNVIIASLASGQILQSGASSYWYNRSFASAFAENISSLSLGSLAVINQLSYGSILNTPSLGSLAEMNSLSYGSILNLPSLGSLAEMNQLSYGSILNLPSLGSLAEMNSLSFYSLISAPSLNGEYLRLDTSNQLSGATLTFNIADTNKNIFVSRVSTTATAGKNLSIQAGGAKSGGTNLAGGTLELKSGIATGNNSSDITFFTATAGSSGAVDRNPTQKMVVKGSGRVGIGNTNPLYTLDVSGSGHFLNNLTVDGSVNTTTLTSAYYGDGSDGNVSFDALNEYGEFSTYNGSGVYTLTRDVYALTITINSGITVKTAGYRIICKDTLTNDGVIDNSGTNAVNNTAGVGGTGGFFKAGTNGVAGLGTGSAGANGTAPTTVANLVGGIGGRGGAGYASQLTFDGVGITSANAAKPSANVGGSKLVSNITNFQISFIPSGTAANIEFTPSTGGGSGAKSATGTTAVSGAGGGGGGTVYVAARKLVNNGTISANGGNGGDASAGLANTANIGGGGGGGGGIVCIVTNPTSLSTTGYVTAFGGFGGLSVDGNTNSYRAVALAGNSATSTTAARFTFTPTTVLQKQSIYMISVVVVGGTVDFLNVPNFTTTQIDTVSYATIATPTRTLYLYYATWNYQGTEMPQIDNQQIQFEIGGSPTSVRVMIDEIQNADVFTNPPYAGFAQNSSDSTANLTVDLGYTPTTGNMIYSVFQRVGGSAPTAGTGNSQLNNQTALPYLFSEVSLNRQTNNHTWTTATAAAGISVDLIQPSTSIYNTSDGWGGKVIYLEE